MSWTTPNWTTPNWTTTNFKMLQQHWTSPVRALALAGALAACSGVAPQPAEAGERAEAGLYRLEVVDEVGHGLRTFDYRGRTYVLGNAGQRYRIRVHNLSGRRVEAVVSVDGRDALDGKPAHTDKSGYLVMPHSAVTIDGFRLSMQDVATFRFGAVAQSYAAQMGNAQNVGVIGVAVFAERYVPPPRPVARPMPCTRCDGDEVSVGDTGASRSAPRAEAKAAPAPAGGQGNARGRAQGSVAEGESSSSSGGKGASGALADRAAVERPGLGTTFGERRQAPVMHVDFQRASPHHPDAILALRYNDRSGLVALGIDVDGPRWRTCDEQWQRQQARPFGNVSSGFAAPPPGWE